MRYAPRFAALRIFAVLAAVTLLCAVSALAQSSLPQPPATRKPLHPHPRARAAQSAKTIATPVVAAVPVAPPEPELPRWPANDHPGPATVTWDSQGLRIEADNSSLAQILRDVATATGATIEGFSDDQRVFGSFGPGQARDILSLLLQGSGYNVLMMGDQGQGTPRRILLSLSNGAPHGAQAPASGSASAEEDDADNEEPAPQPEPQRPPGLPARTPQQIMQEMQLRQQQMQQRGGPPNNPNFPGNSNFPNNPNTPNNPPN
jgi:hypothetical protein